MSEINEKRSFTEYTVTTPTTDFPFGFEFKEGVDVVRVLIDNVDALEVGYTLRLKNSSVVEITPPVDTGTVRIMRETDVDESQYVYTAGALFEASTMDANFKQILHSQQEVRDNFEHLEGNVMPLVAGLEVALEAAAASAEAAQEAADVALEVASQVSAKLNKSDIRKGALDWKLLDTPYNEGFRVVLSNGDIVRSTILNNMNDPNTNMTGWVFSSSGLYRTQKDINNDWVNVRNYGAVGDGVLHTVNDWTVIGSRIYYPSLAAIQVDYPFVSSLSDSVDWAGIQRALNTGKHVLGPFGNYKLGGESLFYKTDGQQVLNLGSVNIDASHGKPCIHIGANDKNGTPRLTWRGKFSGTDFYGTGTRAVGSAGINLVSCSQIEFNFRATGFHEGMSISGACYANTFNTPTLTQNTYGIGDRNSIADLQGSVFLGGRIEQNKLEGVKFASVNTKFIGTVIEGNGLWDGGTGSTPEVTILDSTASGAVTFDACYMESLNGKSAGGIIEIAPSAKRYVFINGGEYFGGVSNKANIVVVDIKAPASASVGVNISGAYVSDVKNYVRGVISGDSRVSIVNCMPKEPLTVWTDVTVGTGLPLIQQFDREYWYTNQNIRVKQVTATGPITGSSLTVTDTATAKYMISTDANIGRTEFANFLQSRQQIQASVSASPLVATASELPSGLVYLLEVKALGKATLSDSHCFKASLLINNPTGTPTIAWQNIDSNSKVGQTLNFSFDGSNNLIVTSTAGASLNTYLYRFFKVRHLQS